MPRDLPLAGASILVTRPAAQAQNLCSLIEQQGGRAIRVPMMDITAPQNPTPAAACISRLKEFDIAIFISVNAVVHGLGMLAQDQQLPYQVKIATVGKRTAEELAQHGYFPTIIPTDTFNSEGLLATEAMQAPAMAGKKVLIFRGEGGRELLAETLRQRGAQVEYAEVYRRTKPQQGLRDAMRPWVAQDINAVVITSNEGLQNFYDLASDEGLIKNFLDVPLVVVSERANILASELGFTKKPVVASDPSDIAMVAALYSATRS